MATAAHQVVTHAAGGDPSLLARISVRFSSLVLPGDTLQFDGFSTGAEGGHTTIGLRVTNQNGIQVLTKARAEIRTQ